MRLKAAIRYAAARKVTLADAHCSGVRGPYPIRQLASQILESRFQSSQETASKVVGNAMVSGPSRSAFGVGHEDVVAVAVVVDDMSVNSGRGGRVFF